MILKNANIWISVKHFSQIEFHFINQLQFVLLHLIVSTNVFLATFGKLEKKKCLLILLITKFQQKSKLSHQIVYYGQIGS
jgi:hypothetical protein